MSDMVIYLSLIGAFAFGGVIGWVTYGILRRSDRKTLTDITTVIGALGGAVITAQFPTQTGAFGAYCIGLALGFFLYPIFATRPGAPDWLGTEPGTGSQSYPTGGGGPIRRP